ncbi:hypothetical protein ARMSODRAFT_1025065 [Armillaria solidipes]|uniref:Uncharacterized protein n=1 Tax=Armillaria solidipes TaxID=1076256 RepID=A0A2H3BE92_9AGAR|nr:hypothetical protein ARMSODRAFT_1025065 [Armillaria solidipes]
MFFTLFGVFLTAFFPQIFGFPITISNERVPQANQEGTVVLNQDPYYFYLASFEPRVTPGRGRERRSAENLVAGPKPPISFDISGIPHIDTLCGELVDFHATSSDAHVSNEGIGTNEILARSANFEVLENLNDKDLLKDGRKDITLRADSGGPIILNKVKNGRNTTSGSITINGGHGSTAISGNAKIKVGHGGAALSGNATTGQNGTATSGKVTINGGSGGSATSGDATSGDDGNSTSGKVTINGGSGGSAISGDAISGDSGNATSGNAINSGNGGSAISGDATVNGTSAVDGEPVSSGAATSVEIASATASPSTTSRHHTKAPVIIGSTIGSLALVVILVLLAILWRRRKSRSRDDNTSEAEGLPTESRPESTRTRTVSSSSAYPSPFEPIRRGGDFPLPSGDSLPQTRMLSPFTGSYWRPGERNRSLERENSRRPAVEVVETTYGASPPPSYLSPQ